jgi:polyhydroxyalkanoate synthesis repressor PhaR
VARCEKNRLCCPIGQGTKQIIMSAQPVIIKRYAGQRLYNPGAGGYVTIEELGAMVEDEEDFVIYDAETGDDVTRGVLKQIIVERARHG